MSALPKAVKEQIARAAEIAALVYPADPAVAAEPAAAVEPAAAAEPAAPVEPSPEEKFDHRYRVLQGKYNAEVPRLQSQLRDATGVIDELRQRVNNTESLLAAMSSVPAAPATPSTSSGITEEERDQFGPDLIDVIERVAAHKLKPEIAAAVAPLSESVARVTKTAGQQAHAQAVSKRQALLSALSEAVPNWEQQNEDPEFLTWLSENDAYAGVARGKLLREAFNLHDTRRVIAFFKGFQTEHAVVTPTSVTPAKQPLESQRSLDEYVAPGTPKTGTIGTPNESGKRVWTRNDISAFYAKKNGFVTKGKPIPKEMVAAEKDLIAAQGEGRIR
jgi:hypothetical protein